MYSEQLEAPMDPHDIPADIATEALATSIAGAGTDEREDIVDDLQGRLAEEDVIVIDASSAVPEQRRGVRTHLTREQLLDALEISRAMRVRRVIRSIGRQAI